MIRTQARPPDDRAPSGLPSTERQAAPGLIARLGSRAGRLLLVAVIIAVLAAVLVPILVTIRMSLWSGTLGAAGHFTWQNYSGLLSTDGLAPLLGTTLIFTLGSAVGGTVIGGVLAWITTSTNVPFRRLAYLMPMLPLLIPPFMKDAGWIVLYRPRTGLMNVLIRTVFHVGGAPINIYTLAGMIVIGACTSASIAYVILISPMAKMNTTLEEASRVSGASAARTVFRITIPILTPAVASALALTAILIAQAFELPVLVGLPGGVRTFVSAIYSSLQNTAIPDYNDAAAQCIVYILLTCIVLLVYLRVTRIERRFAVVTGQGYSHAHLSFGWTRWLLFAGVLVYTFFAALQVIGVTIFVAFVSFFSVIGNNVTLQFSTGNFTSAFEDGTVMGALIRSLWVSLVVAALVTFTATMLSYLSARGRFVGRRALEAAAMLPIAIPPLVLSVGLLLSVLTIPGLVGLYSTPMPLLIADAVVFLPFGMRVIMSAVLQVSSVLEEASRTSGASKTRTITRVVIPLLRPAIMSSIAMVFAFSFRELGAIVLLVPPRQEMVPTELLQFFGQGQYGQVAVLNLLSVAALGLALAIITSALSRVRRDAPSTNPLLMR